MTNSARFRLVIVSNTIAVLATLSCNVEYQRDDQWEAPLPLAPIVSPLLTLNEVDVIPAPLGFAIADIVVSQDGAVLLRSETEGLRIRYPDSHTWSSRIGPLPYRVVGASFDVEYIEILDAGSRAAYTVTRTGEMVSQTSLCDGEHIRAAARASEGWFMITQELADSGSYIKYVKHEELGDECIGDLPPLLPLRWPGALLSTNGEDALLTRVSPPLTTTVVSPTGAVGARLAATTVDEPQAITSEGPLLSSMPLLALDRGYFLQVISEPTNDLRHVILYDSEGNHIRRTTISGAIGFVHSVPSAQLLAGLRSVGRPEVVIYRWAWRQPMG